MLILVKKLITKILTVKLMISLKYQCIIFCVQKFTFQIDVKKFSWRKMLKILCRRHFIKDLHGEEIIRAFHEKQLQKTNQKEFRTEKVIKRKDNKLNAKHTIIRLIAGYIKNT